MKVIGLTGGTGSGKSLASVWLEKQNADIIDADGIAHDSIKKGNPAYEEVVEFFGTEILDETGEIIRRALGNIVFQDAEKLSFLNQATHKHIRNAILEEIERARKQQRPCAVLDAPLLIEADLLDICDEVWVVAAKEEVRIQRIMERDGLTEKQAKERIANQKTLEEYKKYADVILYNDQDIPYLEQQLETVFARNIGDEDGNHTRH